MDEVPPRINHSKGKIHNFLHHFFFNRYRHNSIVLMSFGNVRGDSSELLWVNFNIEQVCVTFPPVKSLYH